MPDDKDVAVRLTATNDLFKKAMLDAEGSVKGLASTVEGQFKKIASSSDKDLKTASSGVDRMASRMMSIGAASAAMGAGMIAVGMKMASTFEDYGKSVLKVQRYTGLSAEASSKLAFTAQQSGISVDQLTKGLGMMARGMANTPDKFVKLGIAVRDSSGNLRSTSDVLGDVAAKVAGTSNQTERLTIAQAAFGRSGAEMLPMLQKGRDGIAALGEQAEKYGLVLTQNNLDAVKKAIAAHREFDAAIQGVKVQIGEQFLPVLTAATSAFSGLIAGTGGAAGSIMMWGGAALVAGGGAMTLVGQLVKMRSTFSELGPAMQGGLSALGAAGIVAAGAAIAWDIFQNKVNEVSGTVKKWTDSQKAELMAAPFEKQQGMLDVLNGKIRDLEKSADAIHWPWDMDKLAQINKMTDAEKQLAHQQQTMVDSAQAISDATGISTDQAWQWMVAQSNLGRVFTSSGDAVDAYTGKVDAASVSNTDNAVAAGLMTTAQQKAADKIREQIAMLQAYSDAGSEVADTMTMMGNSAAGGLAVGSANVETIGGYMLTLSDNTSSANDKIKALDGLLKGLADAATGTASAVDGFQGDLNKFEGLAKALADQKGGWSGTTDAALAWRGQVRKMVTDVDDVASSMAAAGKKPDEIRYALGMMGQKAVDEAKRMGLPADAVQDLVDAIARVPYDTIAQVHTPGVGEAIDAVTTLNGKMAVTALGAVGIIAVPGTDGSISLTNALNEQLGHVKEGADGTVSVRGADGSWYAVALVNGQLSVVKQGANANITADTSQAAGAIDGLKTHFYEWSANIPISLKFKDPFTSANGNIFTAYAQGGISNLEAFANGSENHVAQIAPAGAMRLWAEPETGGEAYIPLSPSKRTRSMAILGQVAGMFGAGGGGDTNVSVTVNAPGYLGDQRDLAAAVAAVVPGAVRDAVRRNS